MDAFLLRDMLGMKIEGRQGRVNRWAEAQSKSMTILAREEGIDLSKRGRRSVLPGIWRDYERRAVLF